MAGFTMIELLIGLVVLAVIASLAVPGYRTAALNSSIRGSTMNMVTAVNVARAQAVSLRQDIELKPLDGADWNSGWIVDYPAAAPEQDQEYAPDSQITVAEANGVVTTTFQQTGLITSPLDFTICDNQRGGEIGRRIQVNRLGRLQTDEVACP